jgi:ferrous iron transport protein B
MTTFESKRLSELRTKDEGIITKVHGHGAFRKRITEMGFVKGKKVKVIKNAPLQDPVEYEIMDYNVSLRRSEAALVEVVTTDLAELFANNSYEGTIDETTVKETIAHEGKSIHVALVGNPNSGKTTLFNLASGSHERVGNYGGVTIDAKEASMEVDDYKFSIVDLPGTYSITEYTPEELYVRSHIVEKTPDVIINVIDASNLERNLFLTTQLIDMQVRVVIALNMFDEFEATGAKLDCALLGNLLGIPVIPTVASKGKGMKELFHAVIDVYEETNTVRRTVNINYGKLIEDAIAEIQEQVEKIPDISVRYAPRYLAMKLLEKEKSIQDELENTEHFPLLQKIVAAETKKLEDEYAERTSTILADAKYGFVAGALGEALLPAPADRRKSTRDIDTFITHKIFGFPVFIFFMWIMFQATFSIGKYPMNWIDAGVGALGDYIKASLAQGPLRDLLVDGIIGGVGGVIIFLPNILILFFFISLMEDTGYMARAAFIMDKLMHKIGLHGKSFIPLLMGFGCNVPAIMATRTLENRKDRILTMLITPFMSCSARLPVYVLIISAIFPKNQGLVLLSIYFIGVSIAVIVALIMKKLLFAKQDVPFVMELPPYRVPTLRNTTKHMWFKAVQYLRKMGNVILMASILIWALGYFPRNVNFSRNYDEATAQIDANTRVTPDQAAALKAQMQMQKESERREGSYIGQLGHVIEPAIRPLGFDWKIGVSILTGLAAKEIVVSTMGVLYQAGDEENGATLASKIKEQVYTSGPKIGQKVFTPLTAFTFMLFVLVYFPCVAVIAAIRKESNWKWAVFTMVYTTAIAWIISLITYQIGSLFI